MLKARANQNLSQLLPSPCAWLLFVAFHQCNTQHHPKPTLSRLMAGCVMFANGLYKLASGAEKRFSYWFLWDEPWHSSFPTEGQLSEASIEKALVAPADELLKSIVCAWHILEPQLHLCQFPRFNFSRNTGAGYTLLKACPVYPEPFVRPCLCSRLLFGCCSCFLLSSA